MKFFLTRPLTIMIAGLLILRIILLFVMPNLPQLEQFGNGGRVILFLPGDDIGYYRLATMIYHWEFERISWTLGFPITELPFIAIFGEGHKQVVSAVAVFNSFFLFSAALMILIWLARRIFNDLWSAWFTGLMFVSFPFLFYLFRDFGPHFAGGNWNDFNFFYANWISAMSDPLSAFLTLVYFTFLIWGMGRERGPLFQAFLGFIAGYAMMVRVSSIVLIVPSLIIYLWSGWRAVNLKNIFSYFIGGAIGFMPQLIYNAIFFGVPWHFGYADEYEMWLATGAAYGPKFGLDNIWHLVARAYYYSPFIVVAAIIGCALLVLGMQFLYRKNKREGVAIVLWFILPVMFYVSFTTGQTTFRYYLPAVPPFLIILVAGGRRLQELFLRRS